MTETMFVKRYVFRPDAIAGHDAFKISNLRVSPTFVSENFVTRWRNGGLSGLDFMQVWPPTQKEASFKPEDRDVGGPGERLARSGRGLERRVLAELQRACRTLRAIDQGGMPGPDRPAGRAAPTSPGS